MSNLPPVTASEVAAWLLAGAALTLALLLQLLPGLLAGVLVYELVHMLAPVLQRRLSGERAKLLAVAALAILITAAVTVAIFGAVAFLRSDAGSPAGLLKKLAEIIETSRATLPRSVAEHLPANADDLKLAIVSWLRAHAADVQLAGKQTGRAVAHILFGLIIGAMVSLHEARPMHAYRPLARALIERGGRFATAFRRIVFAQIRISALNTTITAIYLMLVLPMLGIDLPLRKTLVVVTFIAGLLPVVGNLISNTAIVIVSLSHSLAVAVASLVFLVVIHKLEYFLNARIVSVRIKARAWEVLLAMLVMEAAFGLIGVLAAPIYYGYLKDELAARELV
jgi:predicted PurR-regulated permease PerM